MKVVREESRFKYAGPLACALWVACTFVPLKLAGQPPMTYIGCNSPDSEFVDAENQWQLTVVNPKQQTDTIDARLRARRNATLLPILRRAQEVFLELQNSDARAGITCSGGSYLGDVPELPPIPHAVWIVAKFDSFKVYSADSQGQLPYTEINLRVQQVIRMPRLLSIAPGSLLDIWIASGRIMREDGGVTSFNVRKAEYFFQPGHVYLLHGTVDPTTRWLDVNKRWDVSTGRVAPNGPVEIDRAKTGHSVLSGAMVEEAVKYLDSALPDSDE